VLAIVAGGLSAGAAVIHLAVVGEHFAEYPPFGILFAALGWFQLGWAAAYVARPGRRLASLGLMVSLAVLVVWVASRTIGLPFGPEPGAVEPLGPLDLACSGFEGVLILVVGTRLVAGNAMRRRRLGLRPAVMAAGLALVTVALVTSVAFGLSGGSAHGPVGHLAVDHDAADLPPEIELASPAADGTARPSPLGVGAPSPTESSETADEPPITGSITLGTGLDLAGGVEGVAAEFRLGQVATWVAELRVPVSGSVWFVIVQRLPDGREFEHWRQELPLTGPTRRITGMADLSIYAHNGAGTYLLRYQDGDAILAEGAFKLTAP
jgi:hypothetical protein